MQREINDYIINHLSPCLCGYRKGYNTQQALVCLIEKWKTILDNKGFGGAVLMDLLKAFESLNYELLIGKLANGFNRDSLKLINNYQSNRWQRTKINKSLVVGQNWYKEFLRDLYWALYFLIFT